MSDKKEVRNRWGHPMRLVSKDKFDPSMTVASHAKGLTVNEIMKRYAVTGTIPDRGVPPVFMDGVKSPSLFEALNLRTALNQYFMSLPSGLRGQFLNDPLKLVQFVNDPKNVSKGVELGLLKLNEKGIKAKTDWDKAQAKKKADDRAAFVADVSQILRETQTPPGTNPS